MKDYILRQLQSCRCCSGLKLDPNTNQYIIPKFKKITYELHKCYLVKLSPEVVNNTTNNLAINWNKGTAPKYQYLKIYVSNILGNNLQVDTMAYDFENKQDVQELWSGWLTTDNITQIMCL